MKSAGGVCLLLLLVLVAAFGCQSSTEPGSGTGHPDYIFEPAPGTVVLQVGSSAVFSVATAGGETFNAEWTLGGQVLSQSPNLQYQADLVGVYTIEVKLVAQGETTSEQWLVQVVSDPSSLPPVVGSIEIAEGVGPGGVRLSWNAVTGGAYPIVSYEIACSFSGPLAIENWDQADILLSEPATTGIGYAHELTPDDGLIPGTHVWFGIRAQDTLGQLSPLPMSYAHFISFAWTLEGNVIDDFGEPMASVILRLLVDGQQSSTTTSNAGGVFQFGGLSSVDSVRVSALAIDPNFYSFTSPTLRSDAAGKPVEITLIEKYGVDATCNANAGYFLSYLRFMTLSDDQHGGVLRKWDSYPIKVYIPEFVRGDGIDFGTICQAALDYWNSDLGLELFMVTSLAEDAQVVVDFTTLNANLNGQVVLVAPPGSLGVVTPEAMRMDIDKDLVGGEGVDTGLAIKGVCLHEFGHVLGLYDHSNCDGYHLMNFGNGTFAFKPETERAITIDEHNAVRCLRFLPDGVDMNAYDNN